MATTTRPPFSLHFQLSRTLPLVGRASVFTYGLRARPGHASGIRFSPQRYGDELCVRTTSAERRPPLGHVPSDPQIEPRAPRKAHPQVICAYFYFREHHRVLVSGHASGTRFSSGHGIVRTTVHTTLLGHGVLLSYAYLQIPTSGLGRYGTPKPHVDVALLLSRTPQLASDYKDLKTDPGPALAYGDVRTALQH